IKNYVGAERGKINGNKLYSLWDIYKHANLVTYPSNYEGFGNALLEAVYSKKPVVVNRYPVYNADIKPLGFEFIELDGFIDGSTVERVRQLLQDQGSFVEAAKRNFEIAREHFSLEVLEKKLSELIASF
ncbi:MAG: glycosyltransferase, partial [Anaerolineaceae bacterium]|nr:glycosyltransferase [Anaerolineaceae bacterium]